MLGGSKGGTFRASSTKYTSHCGTLRSVLGVFIFKELTNSLSMRFAYKSGPPLCRIVVQIAGLYDFTVPWVNFFSCFSLLDRLEICRTVAQVDHWDPLAVALPNPPSSASESGEFVT